MQQWKAETFLNKWWNEELEMELPPEGTGTQLSGFAGMVLHLVAPVSKSSRCLWSDITGVVSEGYPRAPVPMLTNGMCGICETRHHVREGHASSGHQAVLSSSNLLQRLGTSWTVSGITFDPFAWHIFHVYFWLKVSQKKKILYSDTVKFVNWWGFQR